VQQQAATEAEAEKWVRVLMHIHASAVHPTNDAKEDAQRDRCVGALVIDIGYTRTWAGAPVAIQITPEVGRSRKGSASAIANDRMKSLLTRPKGIYTLVASCITM
jgi:hypothetical protein